MYYYSNRYILLKAVNEIAIYVLAAIKQYV